MFFHTTRRVWITLTLHSKLMSSEKTVRSIEYHNKLSSSFRQAHVDGLLGGITTRGFINMNFYAERFPIPKSTTVEVINGDTLGAEMGHSEDSKKGVIREYEFGIYIDQRTASEMVMWLIDKIQELERLKDASNNK